MQNLLNEVESLKEKINESRPFTPDISQIIQEKLRIDWTYNSNALEGNTLTYGETAFFLKEGLTSEGRPLKDYIEARNHAEAIDGLYEIINNDRQITESLIKEIHAFLLRDIHFTFVRADDGSLIKKPLVAGKYKTRPNHVLTVSGKVHYYTDPLHVDEEMAELVKWLNSKKALPAIEKAAIFHYKFTAIHPFDDGNGRMARLLMNLILIKEGYPPCIIKNEHRREYLEILHKVDETGDYGVFVEFVANELKKTMQNILQILKGEKTDVEREEEVLTKFNPNQRAKLIIDILEEGPLSIGQILQRLPLINRATLKKDLQKLVKDKKIIKTGKKKGVIYAKS